MALARREWRGRYPYGVQLGVNNAVLLAVHGQYVLDVLGIRRTKRYDFVATEIGALPGHRIGR